MYVGYNKLNSYANYTKSVTKQIHTTDNPMQNKMLNGTCSFQNESFKQTQLRFLNIEGQTGESKSVLAEIFNRALICFDTEK